MTLLPVRPSPRPRGTVAVAVVVAFALGATACGLTREPLPEGTVGCDLGRGNHQGAAGHDLAASTRLPDGRVLFVFGDTYLGSVRVHRRRTVGLLNSSAGVLPRGAGICSRKLRYLTGADGRIRALLPPAETRGSVFWPVDVAVWRGRVWMLYRWVQRTKPGSADVRIRGTGLAWARPDDLRFHPARRLLVAGNATVPSALAADGPRLRALTCARGADGCTTATIDPDRVALVADGPPGEPVVRFTSTEMTLARLRIDGRVRWRASGMEGFTCKVRLATALDPSRPWSDPDAVLKPAPVSDHGSLCYAGRVQEAFSDARHLVITWVDSPTRRANGDQYWPHVREITLPEG